MSPPPAHAAKTSLKKVSIHAIKTPVLTNGHMIAAAKIATCTFHRLSSLYTSEANQPARRPLAITTRKHSAGFAWNTIAPPGSVPVTQLMNTMAPKVPPSSAPADGPNTAPPNTIGISTREILNPPTAGIILLTNCSTTTSAIIRAMPAMRLIF